MKATILFRNVGDIWDKDENKRVTGKKDQDIIKMACCRGLSALKKGVKIIFPDQPGIESYLKHVADFLMPGKNEEEQMKYMNSVIIPTKLAVGDATTEDYLDAKHLNDPEIRAKIEGGIVEPYVDGEPVKIFADQFDCEYHSEFHDLFFKVRNKAYFHHFCEEFGLSTIPESIVSGMEGNYEQQCQDIFNAIKTIFEKAYEGVMIRQVTAAGGIGNARIDKIDETRYKLVRENKVLDSDETLMGWLREFHKTSRTPGMMVAPFFSEGMSLSGIVELTENGEILVPYIAQELLGDHGTSFHGVKIDNDLPEEIIKQAIEMLEKVGQTLKDHGIEKGRFQMDMRTVEGKVRAVESNSLRKTAVIELQQIMADSADWIQECAKRLKNREQKAFVAAEHTPVNDSFRAAVEEHGFHEAFKKFRVLSPEQAKKYFGSDDQNIDIGVILHASTPPHFFDDQMHVGFIIADKAIRPKLGEKEIKPLDEPLAKLSLEEKWELMKEVFRK